MSDKDEEKAVGEAAQEEAEKEAEKEAEENKENKSETEENEENKSDDAGGGKGRDADEGRAHPSGDVFGDDDSEEEDPKPLKKSRLRQADSDDSGDDKRSDKADSDAGEQSGNEDKDDSEDEERSPRKKKDKKKKKDKDKKRKKKRGREDEERATKRSKRRGDGDGEGSDHSGAGSDEEEADNKEKRVFEESDDDAEERDEGIDLETGEVVASKAKSGKYSKKDRREMREKELQRMKDFISKLKRAALDDRNAYKEKRMATKKMELVEQLRVELQRKRTQQDYLELGVLKSLRLWLDPLDPEAKTFKARAGCLPNKKLLAATLELIYDLPMEGIKKSTEKTKAADAHAIHDNMELVEESEIGKSVRFVQNAMETDKTSQAFQMAMRVRQKWTRIICKKSDKLRRSADAMDDVDDEGGPRNLPRANREWEKMPDSVTSSGQKATKGDFGFRYGATVPRPMLVDFMRQPETKIMRNGRELDLEEIQDMAKEGKNETRLRLSKIGVETVRGNTEGRNMRAKAPELNRLHVGGVAAKVTSMGWTDKAEKKK